MRLYAILCIAIHSLLLPHNLAGKKLEWCGGNLNPREAARAARVATSVFWSCKEETVRLNISPAFIKQTDRICALWRLCYSLVEDNYLNGTEVTFAAAECVYKFGEAVQFVFPTWKGLYNFDAASFYEATKKCAFPLVPRGVMYGLKCVDYFRYFISG
ncbi:uncharacterized protein LOC144144574 [Haemaphysalis longicornis]